MKIIDKGLVGKRVKCPICQCISEIGPADKWSEKKFDTLYFKKAEKEFSIKCPQCKKDITIVKCVWLPPGSSLGEMWVTRILNMIKP